MSNRLNKEREAKRQPITIGYAISRLKSIGFEPYHITETSLCITYKGNKIVLYPYSGWFSGKGITDGRGIENLIKQLK